MTERRCLWCDRTFAPRRFGGEPQRLCSTLCRPQFDTAARRWAIKMLDAGELTIKALQNGSVEPYTAR